MTPHPDLQERFDELVKQIRQMVIDHYAKNFPALEPQTIVVVEGRKYWKLIKQDARGGHRSVYGFVDKTNGNLLKAASWAAPAQHARGNLSDNDFGFHACETTGFRYL